MAIHASTILAPGSSHSSNYGDASYIFGAGKALITFGSTDYVIDLGIFNDGLGYGIGGATNVENIGGQPVLLYSGGTAHTGQIPTINPTKIIDFVHDGAYTVQSTDGNYLNGYGLFNINYPSLVDFNVDLGVLTGLNAIYVPTDCIITPLSSDCTAQLGNFVNDDHNDAINNVTNVLEEGDSHTIEGSGQDDGIVYFDGIIKVAVDQSGSNPQTVILEQGTSQLDASMILEENDVVTVLSGLCLINDSVV